VRIPGVSYSNFFEIISRKILYILKMAGQGDKIWPFDLVRKLARSEIQVREFLNLGLRLEPVFPADVLEAVRVQRESGLLTNDSLLLAVLRRLNVRILATADTAFRDISGWIVLSPDDVRD